METFLSIKIILEHIVTYTYIYKNLLKGEIKIFEKSTNKIIEFWKNECVYMQINTDGNLQIYLDQSRCSKQKCNILKTKQIQATGWEESYFYQ